MMHKTKLILLLFVAVCGASCDQKPQAARQSPAPAEETVNKEELLRTIMEADREAATKTPPKPAITFPEVKGWIRSEPRALPSDAHGLTVAYDHPKGATVTLYQFTRGLAEIPDDLNSGPIQNEMQRAKSGIEQAVQLGAWQDAKETDNRIRALGDSPKQALWSRYALTSDGVSLTSDTYVWSHANRLFKLRCTKQTSDSSGENLALNELLTALGNACSTDTNHPSKIPSTVSE